MSVRPALSLIIILFMASLMVTSPVQAGIIPGFVKKLNPFGSTSDVNVDKIKKNIAKNIKELKQKAAQGDPRAMAALAEYYFNGLRMKRNVRKAFDLYQEAAAGGDAVGQFRMGEFYSFGLDMDNDGIFEIPVDRQKGNALRAQSLKGLAKLAGKKHGDALYIMGMLHKRGSLGLEKSSKKSRKYWEKSAKKGHARGMYQFGEILLTEGGKNHKKACDFFVRSAISGFRRGIYAIGYCHEKGRGRPKDIGQAHQWYNYGAKHYSVASMFRMGDITAAKGGDDNKKKAAEYYDMAITEGAAGGYARYARGAHDEKTAYYYQQALAHDLDNTSYLTKLQENRKKQGQIIGLTPGTYTRDDLLNIANKAAAGHAGAKEYAKDFMLMGYIKSLEPVQLLTLGNGFSHKYDAYGTALFFSPDNKTLTIIHKYDTSISHQSVNSTWDVATRELISLRVLKSGRFFKAASPDGKKIIMEVRDTEYWQNSYTGDAKVTLNDSETGQILLTLKELKDNDLFRTYFTGNDKYINIQYDRFNTSKKTFQNRSALYDAATGKVVTDDKGTVFRRVSPDGLHVMTSSMPDKDETYPEEGVRHQRLPTWIGGSKIDKLRSVENGIFSPDGRYWITPQYLYDLKEDKFLGEHDAAHDTMVNFVNIPGTPLLLRIYDSVIVTYLMEGSTLTQVGRQPLDVEWSKFEFEHLFSPDFTMVTLNGVREGSADKETYIQSYTRPTDVEIAQEQEKQKEKNKTDKAMNDVLEMFEIGFDDQAIDQMNEVIAKDPTAIMPAFNMMKKRTKISATSVGLVMKTAIDAALAHTDIIKIDLRLKGEKSDPGTGDAIVKDFVLFQSNVQKAGVRRGDTIISLDGRPYFRSNTPEMQDYIDSIQANQHVTMVVERGGQQLPFTYKTKTVPDGAGLRNAMRQLFWYGLIANAAGHPDIADMAAGRIGELLNQRIFTKGEEVWGDNSRQSIALLKAVALAKRGNHKAAYAILLTEKSMKAENQWGVNHVDWDPDLFADLFKEPKKLAYILGKKVDDLPKLTDKKVTPADYWTLDGRLIKLGETAIVKENEGGSVID
ncbi:MAG: hypothetical protein COB54_01310 [Alphaproteobacteria bacterium]|nr:MAG: hypothetical protein COB54_01310 [Alphaproteobacteria bacterium]